jgi:hypothetical protein
MRVPSQRSNYCTTAQQGAKNDRDYGARHPILLRQIRHIQEEVWRVHRAAHIDAERMRAGRRARRRRRPSETCEWHKWREESGGMRCGCRGRARRHVSAVCVPTASNGVRQSARGCVLSAVQHAARRSAAGEAVPNAILPQCTQCHALPPRRASGRGPAVAAEWESTVHAHAPSTSPSCSDCITATPYESPSRSASSRHRSATKHSPPAAPTPASAPRNIAGARNMHRSARMRHPVLCASCSSA